MSTWGRGELRVLRDAVDFEYLEDVQELGSGHDSRDEHWSWTTWRAVVTIRVTGTGLGPREGQWSQLV